MSKLANTLSVPIRKYFNALLRVHGTSTPFVNGTRQEGLALVQFWPGNISEKEFADILLKDFDIEVRDTKTFEDDSAGNKKIGVNFYANSDPEKTRDKIIKATEKLEAQYLAEIKATNTAHETEAIQEKFDKPLSRIEGILASVEDPKLKKSLAAKLRAVANEHSSEAAPVTISDYRERLEQEIATYAAKEKGGR